jgi:c-di-GMP-binding flagellar brake protein YcgR
VVASLSAGGLAWRVTGVAPMVGAVGMVELYPRAGVAEAVRLPGKVVACGADGQISFEFAGLSEAETDVLERFVFRQHRRKIAGRRRGG